MGANVMIHRATRITFSFEQLEVIRLHAVSAAPEECCGILAGTVEAGCLLVREVHPSENVQESDRGNRFELDTRLHLRLQRECRERGLRVIGFYHSHPESAAIPSGFDRELAWPEVSYVIVSLENDQLREVRSWRLDGETEGFVEEVVEVV